MTRNKQYSWTVGLTLILIFGIILTAFSVNSAFWARNKSELLLRFKPGVSPRIMGGLMSMLGLEVVEEIPQIRVLVVSVPQDALPYVKAALSRNPMVDFAEENTLVDSEAIPNDQYYGFQWHLGKIGAPAAWDVSLGDSKITVAVLDSGIDPNHPDLAAKLLPGYNFYDNNENITDVTGHGTAVAGVAAAATNNSLGVAGVSWRSSILPVRVTGPDGYTTYSLLSKGLVYAADRGAKAATISFRIFGGQALSSAAKYFMDRGGLVFAAGGNTGEYYDDVDNPYIISLSGTTGSDLHWGSYGPYIDLSAPCSAIYTTIRGGSYGNVGGTSFSAPLAAGLAALISSANPSLTPAQVEQVLEAAALDLGEPSYDIYYGWGRIDAAAALRAAVGIQPPRDTVPPNVSIDYPVDGSTVSGALNVKVNASDNVGVSKVELYKDGALFATDFDAPHEFYWDTTGEAAGVHNLKAKAYDLACNAGESNVVNVAVNVNVKALDITPPFVGIIKPIDGSTVSKTIDVAASASDESGIAKVEFYVGGKLLATFSQEPYTYRWNTRSVKDGWHTITVKAYDNAGNSAETSIKVRVSNRK